MRVNSKRIVKMVTWLRRDSLIMSVSSNINKRSKVRKRIVNFNKLHKKNDSKAMN